MKIAQKMYWANLYQLDCHWPLTKEMAEIFHSHRRNACTAIHFTCGLALYESLSGIHVSTSFDW